MECTRLEMAVIFAARELAEHNGKNLIAGIGLPVLVTKLAKEMYAPDLTINIESGSFDVTIPEVPISLFGPRISYRCSAQLSNLHSLAGTGRGDYDIGFIGGAQVDKYGNVNSTVVGEYLGEHKRLAGSGGAVDIGCFTNTIIIIPHDRRKLVEMVDYITTPGWMVRKPFSDELIRREELGLPGGPMMIVTNLCIMKFDKMTKEAYVEKIYPGVSKEEIIQKTGFDVDMSRAKIGEEIKEEEIAALRKIDPFNVYRTR
ncbi:CoA-transferase subunit beta [Archaeoglobus neptunius]|uniref:CoA-transferase subunit beta n=1 Tax=Archaeoglobus neptunius TaxID=2798580 RepID=UPI0019261E65|nr:CoA-transferase [Archaeoglobus neptunius]